MCRISFSMDGSEKGDSVSFGPLWISGFNYSGNFEKEHYPLALITGKVINSLSAISTKKHWSFSLFRNVAAMLSRSRDVATKLSLRTGHMTHTSTPSAASCFNVSCYVPIGVTFFISRKFKIVQSMAPSDVGP